MLGPTRLEAREAVRSMNKKKKTMQSNAELVAKLPAYVTGERFVPGLDEWFSVEIHHDPHATAKWTVWSHTEDYAEHFGNAGWMPSDCCGHSASFAGFYKTRESAQAEADRLNEEGA